jgi:integrase
MMAGERSIVSQSFVDMLVKAGVRAPKAKVRGVRREGAEKYLPLSFHCLRHNHTTMLKRANIPEAIARRIAGHLSIAISDVYTHLGEDVMRAAVANLPEIEGVSTCY